MSGFTGIKKEYFKDHRGRVVRIEIQHWKNGKIVKYEDKLPIEVPSTQSAKSSKNKKYEDKLKRIDQMGKYQKKLIDLSK